ncbi:MAG: pilin [Candidatus Gracilibacteria bacterium]|jgi:VIT1/CCC1 family predicted Fe2+/Mn2+ transporter|nr:pilin [Candidatus Gracilibacteria bacterium]
MEQDNFEYKAPKGIASADKSINDFFGDIASYAFIALSSVAVCIIIYGAICIITAAGDEEKTEKAKKIIKMATIGLAVVLLSYGIVEILTSLL